VKESVKEVADGTFKGGVYVGTLANEGVGLAPFHDFDCAVPAALKSGIDALKAKIIDGSVKVARSTSRPSGSANSSGIPHPTKRRPPGRRSSQAETDGTVKLDCAASASAFPA